jgi:hypothetical protein
VQEGQRILEICAVTLGIALILLVFAVLHRRHLNRISRQISQLPPNPEGTDRILDAIEGARMQISSTGDELRAQGRTLRDRIDALIATIAKFVRGVP